MIFFLNGLDIGETSFSYLNLKKCDFNSCIFTKKKSLPNVILKREL